jgi:hypothetical protein
MNKSRSIPKIHVRYKRFQKEQRDIWESFCLIDFYAPKIKDAVKEDVFPQLSFDRIWNETSKVVKKNDIYGALHSLAIKGNFRRTLLETVLTFEDYITDLIQSVYLDIPGKLSTSQDDANNSSGYQKLLKLVLTSTDKQEIVDKLVEEKIRSIFYGNPLDVFEKDKARLEFGTYFKDNHSDELKIYRKVIAMRNVIAHNNGRIDRKYIREVDSDAELGKKVEIDREFLKEAIYTLSIFGAHATRLVVENVYKETISGKLSQAIKAFNKSC